MIARHLLVLAVLSAGCAARSNPPTTAVPPPAKVSTSVAPRKALPDAPAAVPGGGDEAERARGRRVVAHAQALANAGRLHGGARRDCSGFVMDVFEAAGRPLRIPERHRRFPNVSAMLHDWSKGEGRAFKGTPAPGDLVFFRDTVGDLEGKITHVALVERVRADGTVELIHFLSGGIRRDRMNLARPGDHTVNGWLRRKKHAGEPALAGELFVAYARF